MTQPILSIIIPVYNAEKYLHRCMGSILSQSFREYEVLLVNDGSTDTSGAICDEFAVRDERVRVFHKPNGGVSSARNMGLEHAKGEYIYFVDADDEVLPDGLKRLISAATEEVDMVMCNFIKRNEAGDSLWETSYGGDKALSREESILCNYGASHIMDGTWGWMWTWLFKRCIIENNHLRFDEQIAFNEDALFVVQYLCKTTQTIQYIDSFVYCYYDSNSSIMGKVSREFNKKYITSFDSLVAMYNAVAEVYPAAHPVTRIAKWKIWDRYLMVKWYLLLHKQYEEIIPQLRQRSWEACGGYETIIWYISRNINRAKKFIKRKFNNL